MKVKKLMDLLHSKVANSNYGVDRYEIAISNKMEEGAIMVDHEKQVVIISKQQLDIK